MSLFTGYSQYAVEAFSIDASGYILKPAKKADVKNALDDLRIPVVEDIQTGLRNQGVLEILKFFIMMNQLNLKELLQKKY